MPVVPAMKEAIRRKITSEAGLGKITRLYLKAKKGWERHGSSGRASA
jgi:hypothetical protein